MFWVEAVRWVRGAGLNQCPAPRLPFLMVALFPLMERSFKMAALLGFTDRLSRSESQSST